MIGIAYDSSQFGVVDKKTGDFTFGGARLTMPLSLFTSQEAAAQLLR